MSTEKDEVVKLDNGDEELIEYANNDAYEEDGVEVNDDDEVNDDVNEVNDDDEVNDDVNEVNDEEDDDEDDDGDDDEDDGDDDEEDADADDDANESKDEDKVESKEAVQDDAAKFKNCLMATIRIPIRVEPDGSFDMLDGYGEITIEKIEGEIPVETNVSLFSKLAEYMQSHPEYISEIIKEEEDEEDEDDEDDEDEDDEDDEEDEEEDDEEDDEDDEDDEEDVSKINPETELHDFPYLKKSKKPLNTSFRSKPRSLNHSKKNYEGE